MEAQLAILKAAANKGKACWGQVQKKIFKMKNTTPASHVSVWEPVAQWKCSLRDDDAWKAAERALLQPS